MSCCGTDQIGFSLLGLVQDPTCKLRTQLAESIRCAQTLLAGSCGALGLRGTHNLLIGPCPRWGIGDALLNRTAAPHDYLERMSGSGAFADLGDSIRNLQKVQQQLGMSMSEAEKVFHRDEEKAERHRFDFGPILERWTRLHAQKSIIGSFLQLP